jgi:outer membrane protein assembly factor BamA
MNLTILFLLLASACFGAGAGAERKAVVLQRIGEGKAQPRELEWLAQDQQWLGGMGSGVLFAEIVPDSTDVLRRILEQSTDRSSVLDALSRESQLRERWLARGYLGAMVTVTGARGSVADTLLVDTGPRFRIASLEIGGDEFPGRERLLGIWLPRAGDLFDAVAFGQGVERVLEEVSEAGFPFARWVISSVQLDASEGTVALKGRLLPGQHAYFGVVTSDLPPGPGRRFLTKAAGIRYGNEFRHSDLRRAVDRLIARDLYLSVDEPRVYLTSAVDTVGIHFPVVERRKVNRLEVVLGLSQKQDEPGSHISGQVDLNMPNLAGTGRRLAIRWQDDGGDKSRFGFSYLEPLAFGTPLDVSVALDHEVESDLYTLFRFDNNWTLPVVALWGLNLGLGWDRSTFPTGELEGTRRTRALAGIEHRRGDRSGSGWQGRVGVETAWRSTFYRSVADTSDVGSQLGEGTTQRILLGDLGGERWFRSLWSLAGRVSFRQLRGSDEAPPLSEQFRFGGANTLRGYREDEFHGTSVAWAALELRIGRPRGSRLYTFYDVGYFEFSALDPLPDDPDRRAMQKDWPWGFGLGLLARTARGDLSLAIGFPGTVDFQVAKLHVSLMESF